MTPLDSNDTPGGVQRGETLPDPAHQVEKDPYTDDVDRGVGGDDGDAPEDVPQRKHDTPEYQDGTRAIVYDESVPVEPADPGPGQVAPGDVASSEERGEAPGGDAGQKRVSDTSGGSSSSEELTGDDLDAAVEKAGIDTSKGGSNADGSLNADEKRAALARTQRPGGRTTSGGPQGVTR